MSEAKPPVPNIKGRGIQGFYRDVVREMRHVTWPTRQEAFRLSGTVLGICALLTLVLTGFSAGLEQILLFVGIGKH